MCKQWEKAFIKRLERAEAGVEMLEKRRAFSKSKGQKADFKRLSEVELEYLSDYFRCTGFTASKLDKPEMEALDEIFEKAVGIRDSITWILRDMGKYWRTRRPPDPPAPWESLSTPGRHLDRLFATVNVHPDFQFHEDNLSRDVIYKRLMARLDAVGGGRKK